MDGKSMEGLLQELQWCNSTENLEDILKNPKVNLPQLIRQKSELKFIESKVSIKSGQILNILAKRTSSYISGTDSSGKEISLPLSCPYTVQLKVPQNELKTFSSLMDIVNTDPLPKFVEITRIESLSDDQQCSCGEILKVVMVEKSGNIPTFVHFRKSSGTHFKIGIEENISFQLASNYPSNISLCNLFEKARELPIFVQFSPPKKIPKRYIELGTIALHTDTVSTVDFVIAAADITATEYAVLFPLNSNIKFEINTQLKLANDKKYRDLCCNFSKVVTEDVNNYLDQMVLIKQNGYNIIIKNKKLQKEFRCKIDSKVSNHNGHNEIQGTSNNSLKINAKCTDVTDGKNTKHKSNESTKKEKKVKKEKEEKKKKSMKAEKENETDNLYLAPQASTNDMSQSVASHNGDKQWTMLLKKGVKKVCGRSVSIGQKTKVPGKTNYPDIMKESENLLQVTTVNENIYQGLENLYCELPYATLDQVSPVAIQMHDGDLDESDQTRNNVTQTAPPPLPGNHPHQAKINMTVNEDLYLDAVDTRKCIDTMPSYDPSSDAVDGTKCSDTISVKKENLVQKSLSEISAWGIEDVGNCLSNLSLDEYKNLFEDSLVDGKLLLDLDETVLKDLGLNLFEACKLRKFVFGWRPSNMRPKTYPICKGYLSEDPLDWNVEDTASHMNSIDVPGMAKFCMNNQVDGELLKDICVDEGIMNSIFSCPDKKLKILKIRNYVIDQWRPKKKSCEDTSCESVNIGKEVDLSPLKENRLNTSVPINKEKRPTTEENRLNTSVPINKEKRPITEEKKMHFDAPHIAHLKQRLEQKANNWETRKKAL